MRARVAEGMGLGFQATAVHPGRIPSDTLGKNGKHCCGRPALTPATTSLMLNNIHFNVAMMQL